MKGYDKYLFAKREMNGAIHIHRKDPNNSAAPYHMVFALTDNWNARGKPRDWGLEVILARLRAMDLWRDETEVERINKQFEKTEQENERDLKNNIESFLKEFRRQFARATDGINTSTLEKKDRRALCGA